jgi:hypothetical protein
MSNVTTVDVWPSPLLHHLRQQFQPAVLAPVDAPVGDPEAAPRSPLIGPVLLMLARARPSAGCATRLIFNHAS